MKNIITNYSFAMAQFNCTKLNAETITLIIVSLLIVLTLSMHSIKLIKFFVGFGIGLYTYTCMTQIMPNQVASWYLSSLLVFLFVVGTYDNILEQNYIIGILILLLSIFGLIFFIHNFKNANYNMNVQSGFDILASKTKEMINYLNDDIE